MRRWWGTYVAPEAILPSGYELPSTAPIPENPEARVIQKEIATRTIFKYQVEADGEDHRLELPSRAKIVHVNDGGMAPTGVSFWVEFEPSANTGFRTFRIFGTGTEIPPIYGYVGTVDLNPMIPLVWHLYERLG